VKMSPEIRLARCVCEKFAQNVAQSIFCNN
jgi:hypothetical protein